MALNQMFKKIFEQLIKQSDDREAMTGQLMTTKVKQVLKQSKDNGLCPMRKIAEELANDKKQV